MSESAQRYYLVLNRVRSIHFLVCIYYIYTDDFLKLPSDLPKTDSLYLMEEAAKPQNLVLVWVRSVHVLVFVSYLSSEKVLCCYSLPP